MKRLLIVEDDLDLLDDLLAILGKGGFDAVHGGASLPEAMVWVQQHGAPDLGLIDVQLQGGGSGLDFIRVVSRQWPLIPWVIFTVFDDGPTVLSAFDAGASGYLLKSTRPARLVEALQEAAEGGMPMTASIARVIVERAVRRPPQAPLCAEIGGLTPREMQVLEALARGLSYLDVGRLLGIGVGTVQSHVKAIYRKLNVSSKAEATAIAVRAGMA